MENKAIKLTEVVDALDNFFKIHELPKDPAMSRFVPMVYKKSTIPWTKIFETSFLKRFNGLMVK